MSPAVAVAKNIQWERDGVILHSDCHIYNEAKRKNTIRPDS